MPKTKKAAVTYQQEQEVFLAIVNGYRTTDAIVELTNMTVEQVEATIAQLNHESMEQCGEPLVTFAIGAICGEAGSAELGGMASRAGHAPMRLMVEYCHHHSAHHGDDGIMYYTTFVKVPGDIGEINIEGWLERWLEDHICAGCGLESYRRYDPDVDGDGCVMQEFDPIVFMPDPKDLEFEEPAEQSAGEGVQ